MRTSQSLPRLGVGWEGPGPEDRFSDFSHALRHTNSASALEVQQEAARARGALQAAEAAARAGACDRAPAARRGELRVRRAGLGGALPAGRPRWLGHDRAARAFVRGALRAHPGEDVYFVI